MAKATIYLFYDTHNTVAFPTKSKALEAAGKDGAVTKIETIDTGLRDLLVATFNRQGWVGEETVIQGTPPFYHEDDDDSFLDILTETEILEGFW